MRNIIVLINCMKTHTQDTANIIIAK